MHKLMLALQKNLFYFLFFSPISVYREIYLDIKTLKIIKLVSLTTEVNRWSRQFITIIML